MTGHNRLSIQQNLQYELQTMNGSPDMFATAKFFEKWILTNATNCGTPKPNSNSMTCVFGNEDNEYSEKLFEFEFITHSQLTLEILSVTPYTGSTIGIRKYKMPIFGTRTKSASKGS
ncbi:hypothetical protein ACFSM5_11015 [Lacibacterium aquatile]|uniref:Uncharacterized protein n=1 Tax=Lacibacterium aquatile TaxID=1168082 RepID=A0ABW5DRL2_9PROT